MTIHGSSFLMEFLRNGLNGRDQSTKLSNSHRGDMPYYIPSGIVSDECWDKGRAAQLAFSFRRRYMCRVSLCKSGCPDGTCEPGATTILRAFTNDFCAFVLRYQRTNTLDDFRLELDPFFLLFFVCFYSILYEIYTHSFRMLYFDLITSSWAL